MIPTPPPIRKVKEGVVPGKNQPNIFFYSWLCSLFMALLNIYFDNGITATIWVATGFVVIAIDQARKEVKRKMSELADALDFITVTLEKAKTEIVDLIASLQNPALTPVEREKLARVVAIANSLDAIVPDVPPPPVDPPV